MRTNHALVSVSEEGDVQVYVQGDVLVRQVGKTTVTVKTASATIFRSVTVVPLPAVEIDQVENRHHREHIA